MPEEDFEGVAVGTDRVGAHPSAACQRQQGYLYGQIGQEKALFSAHSFFNGCDQLIGLLRRENKGGREFQAASFSTR
jgi:hypothetical protein